MTFPSRLPIPEEVLRIAKKLEDAGYETWCVGGAIRDNLLGLENHDFDLTTAAPPDEVRRLFKRTVPVGIEHGTVAVLDQRGTPHEVTTFRKDIRTDGRHAVVEFGVSLMDDLARRDYTINAIAYHPIAHRWQDPFEGAADLDPQADSLRGRPELALPGGLPEDPAGAALQRAVPVPDSRAHARGGEGERPGAGAALGRARAGRVVKGDRDRRSGVQAVGAVDRRGRGADLAPGNPGAGSGERFPQCPGHATAGSGADNCVPRIRRRFTADPAQVLEQGHRAGPSHRAMAQIGRAHV